MYRSKSSLGLALIALVAVAMSATMARAAVIYSEDFETFTAGAPLNGQGGWSAGANIEVGPPDLGLTTNTISGNSTIGNALNSFSRSVTALVATESYSLVWDAYATSSDATNDDRHSSGASLFGYTAGGNNEFAYWNAQGVSGPNDGWTFSSNTLTGGSIGTNVIGGFDAAIKLRIDVSGVTNLAEGFYDFGAGWVSVGTTAISDAQIASINGVGGLHDTRFTVARSFDIDNINLSTVPIPEPSTIVILGLGLVGLCGCRRRA